MLRAIEDLSAIISATTVVHDDQEAQLRLRTALASYGADGCVIDALLEMLASGDAVLQVGRHGRLILWIRTSEGSECWFSVEPAGFRCLYRNGPETWR
jgi:hypothetical protein